MKTQTTPNTARVEEIDPYSALFEQARRNAESSLAESNRDIERAGCEFAARKRADEPSLWQLLCMPAAALFSRTPKSDV